MLLNLFQPEESFILETVEIENLKHVWFRY